MLTPSSAACLILAFALRDYLLMVIAHAPQDQLR